MENPPEPHPLAAVSSPDHNAERLAALKQLFPDLFSNDGKLNVDELKKVVDPALVSETERYDFRWYGKTKSKREAFTPSRAALVYDPARSMNPDNAAGNMIIEGENLEVLKLLTCSYRERVKCIYIDPPYNTGKDFVYSDNFAEGRKPYWEQTSVTEGGVKVDTNTDNDGRFHSNWLSMMHSRLLVARYLLKPEGVIFVSIDDNEVHNLRRVMDEVFGEENFVVQIEWQKRYTRSNNTDDFTTVVEHILVFARDEKFAPALVERDEEADARYLNPDNDPRGPWKAIPFLNPLSPSERPNLVYTIVNPNTGEEIHPTRKAWRSEKAVWERLVEENRIWWGSNGTSSTPNIKKFLNEVRQGMTPINFWDYDFAGHTDQANAEIKEFLGDKVFDTSKPSLLIRRVIQAAACDANSIILDFFSGSGTSAHAVMEQNKADGGNRKFILVQLPELTAENSPAFKAGFKRISDITIERTRRVIQKLNTPQPVKLLPIVNEQELMCVAETGPEYRVKPANALGFKVFTLAKSAFPRVEFAPDPAKTEAENIELLKQYIRDKEATFHFQFEKDKVLDEVLLKNGFMLDYTLTPQPDFKKNEVLLAKDAHKESLVCLDAKLEPETVDHFKAHKEQFFICLELALDTTKKWNLKHNLGEKLKAI